MRDEEVTDRGQEGTRPGTERGSREASEVGELFQVLEMALNLSALNPQSQAPPAELQVGVWRL